MLTMTDISIRLAGRLLIDHSSVQITPGARVGFVGRNGVGKSSLFHGDPPRDCRSKPGTVTLPPRWRVGSLAQEAPDGPESLISVVFKADLKRDALFHGSRERTRPAPDRRNPDPACRHRRAFGPGPRRRDPLRPRLFRYPTRLRPARILRRLALRVALAATLFAAPDLLL